MGQLGYLFCDLDGYFAAVEQQAQPALRGQPVAVAPMDTDSTCCIAASYEAKAYGIRTGTPVSEARQRCPHIHIVTARVQLYVEYHHCIVEAVERCLHVDCVCSIDEMYGQLMGDERSPERAAELAYAVKAAIRETAGPCLRGSVGLGPNVWLAKVASDLNKPDGMSMILPEQMPEAIQHLSLTDLPGIAANRERRLASVGITNVAELCRADEATLTDAWGSRVLGNLWWQQLHGCDLPPRRTHRRTVGHSHVLPPDWRSEARAKMVAVRLVHKAARRLRRMGYRASRLSLSVDFGNGQQWSQWLGLDSARDTLTIARALTRLWAARPVGKPLKVGVVLDRLIPDDSATEPLFEDRRRLDALADAMDRLADRHGQHVVHLGSMTGAQETAPTRISFTQIPELDEFL